MVWAQMALPVQTKKARKLNHNNSTPSFNPRPRFLLFAEKTFLPSTTKLIFSFSPLNCSATNSLLIKTGHEPLHWEREKKSFHASRTPLARLSSRMSSKSASLSVGVKFNLIRRANVLASGIKFQLLILTGGTCMLMYQISKKREIMMNIYSYGVCCDRQTNGLACFLFVTCCVGLSYPGRFYKNSKTRRHPLEPSSVNLYPSFANGFCVDQGARKKNFLHSNLLLGDEKKNGKVVTKNAGG
jgi:hypothetical protein